MHARRGSVTGFVLSFSALALVDSVAGVDRDPVEFRTTCAANSGLEKCSTSPVPGPEFLIVNGSLRDNGDDDGWADTNETVQMRLTVYNRMGVDLTGVVARLRTDDPDVACILDPIVAIGDLPQRELRTTGEAFTFLIAGVQRADVAQDLTAVFQVEVLADGYELPVEVHEIVIDLDLDATGGSGPTTFFEGFENGFGQFAPIPLDAALNPPDGDLNNHAAGVANADGARCQYSDPDWEGSVSYGSVAAKTCYPNANGAPDAFWFHVVTERSFSGAASMHWGAWVESSARYTTPTAQLEAITTAEPLNLAWERTCELDTSTPCVSEVDCPIGQGCVDAPATLSFVHQISLIDHRSA